MAAERSYKKSKKHKKKSKKRRHKSVSAAQFGAGLWKTWHLLSVIPAGFSKGKVGVKLEEVGVGKRRDGTMEDMKHSAGNKLI